MKIVAFMPVYNEADVLPFVLAHMREQGIDVYALDGWSTDGTYEILQNAGVPVERFPADNPAKQQVCRDILARIEDLAESSDADWCGISDADEWRRSSRAGETLAAAIARVDAEGYNAIDFKVFAFFCTDANWTGNLEQYFRYYNLTDLICRLPQEKFWKNLGRVNVRDTGGHRVEFPGKRVAPEKFIMKHYPYRTPAQAKRRVETRLERRCAQEHEQGWGRHYDDFKPDFSFCWNPKELLDWRDLTPRSSSSTPVFSILHTSARPDEWRKVYEAWLNAADRPEEVEYVLVTDPRWGFHIEPEVNRPKSMIRPQDKVVMNTGRMCYVDGVNLAAENSTGRILIVNADDQFPCEHWDTRLIEKLDVMPWRVEACEFVARVSTGTPAERERNITVMPILSRARYERLGYVLYPEYESMCSDNDLSEHAQRDKCFIEIPDLLFPHRHPFFDSQVKIDDQYRRQNRADAYEQGAQILARRRLDGFNSGPSLVRASDSKIAPKQNIAVCLPGEWFHSTWVAQNAMQLMVHLFGKFRNVWPVMPMAISNVHMARHAALDYISKLPEPVKFVLWIDDDNLLTAEHFDLLLDDLESHPEISGVAGWCWIHPDGRPSVGALDENGISHSWDYQKMMQADADLLPFTGPEKDDAGWSGFPVLLHRYEVIEKIGKFPFRPVLNDAWNTGMSGEDIAFFVNASKAGLRFVCDRRVRVPHLKYGNPEPDWMMKEPRADLRVEAREQQGAVPQVPKRSALRLAFDKARRVVGV